MNGLTVYEPGAPAGQESAVLGAISGVPTISYVAGQETITQLMGGYTPPSPVSGAGAGVIGIPPTAALPPVVIPAIPTALAAIPAAIPALAGLTAGAAALYGLAQLFGLGEGEGLFGLDLLGGDTQYLNGVPLGGPGLAEPPAKYVIKEWHRDTAAGHVQYYRVQMPGWRKPKTLGYYTQFKRWVVFKAPHLAVIGKKLPSHQQLTRLRRNLSRHSADARTILKITSPKSLRDARRRRR